MWDVAAARHVRHFELFDARVAVPASLVMSWEDTYFLVLQDNRVASVWRFSDEADVTDLVGHADVVTCGAFSDRDALVTTASKDRTVRVWNLSDGVCVWTSARQRHHVTFMVGAVPGSCFMVLVNSLGSIALWSVPSVDPDTDTVVAAAQLGERFRPSVLWERVQPRLNTTLSPAYVSLTRG